MEKARRWERKCVSGRYGCLSLWKPPWVWGTEEQLGSRGLECRAQDVGIRKCCDFLETAPLRKESSGEAN